MKLWQKELEINKQKLAVKVSNKFWYGYKKHESVDMQSGLINKVSSFDKKD